MSQINRCTSTAVYSILQHSLIPNSKRCYQYFVLILIQVLILWSTILHGTPQPPAFPRATVRPCLSPRKSFFPLSAAGQPMSAAGYWRTKSCYQGYSPLLDRTLGGGTSIEKYTFDWLPAHFSYSRSFEDGSALLRSISVKITSSHTILLKYSTERRCYSAV